VTPKELEAGKAWVIDTLIKLAGELNVPLETWLWARKSRPSALDSHLLTCFIIGFLTKKNPPQKSACRNNAHGEVG
jgi:hypothetical protein